MLVACVKLLNSALEVILKVIAKGVQPAVQMARVDACVRFIFEIGDVGGRVVIQLFATILIYDRFLGLRP